MIADRANSGNRKSRQQAGFSAPVLGPRHPSERVLDPQDQESELLEGLLGTFPASDPLALTTMIVPGRPPDRDRF